LATVRLTRLYQLKSGAPQWRSETLAGWSEGTALALNLAFATPFFVETLENLANSVGFNALGFISGSAPKAHLLAQIL